MKLIVFLIFIFSCSKRTETPLARVGSSVLYEKDMIFEQGDKIKTKDKAYDFVENWTTEKVLLKKAIDEGYLEDLRLKEERDSFYNNLIISSFLDNSLSVDIFISKDEILEYYNSSKGLFTRKEEEVFVHHFFMNELEQARSIKRELLKKNNKRRTEEINQLFNVESKVIKKGYSINEIDTELFKNKKIGVIGPIRSKIGFHVFDIIKRYEKGSKIGLELAYDEIYQRLLKMKKSKYRAKLIDSLKSETNIFINSKYRDENES